MITSDSLRKLASLNLSQEQMAGVLDLLADVQKKEEDRKAAQRERKQKQRDKDRSRDSHGTVTGQECDKKTKRKKEPKKEKIKNNNIYNPPKGSLRQTGNSPRQQEMSDEAKEQDVQFEQFWQAFPRQRKGNKDRARRAYYSALSRTSPENIHAATVAYSCSDEVARGFAKGAAAWLNDDRWNYDYEPKGNHNESTGRKLTWDERAKRALDEAEEILAGEQAEEQPDQSADRTELQRIQHLREEAGGSHEYPVGLLTSSGTH